MGAMLASFGQRVPVRLGTRSFAYRAVGFLMHLLYLASILPNPRQVLITT
jgi:hypothetical protein